MSVAFKLRPCGIGVILFDRRHSEGNACAGRVVTASGLGFGL